ncbi:MAG: metallophosphoesterase [Prevotella sp.]|jgi:predicted MPP superfamily phosphohydrolase|nr:metallophosphoesterase [Prevotella sp.]MBQ5495758.1 metallophosphoesterase [Prevotella sp.]
MIARYAIPFFFFMGLIVAPLVFSLLCRWLAPRRHWRKAAIVCSLLAWGLVFYGYFVGFSTLEVRQFEYASADLPEAFDGYRIVQFSDAHVGSYNGSMLENAIETINAQGADAIVFTGDLENLHPDELEPQMSVLSQLHAKDGVFSVLGNHDYPTYLDCDEATKAECVRKTKMLERKMGWQLLLNEHQTIRRDSDSIVIAGMENWGTLKRMPRLGDVKKTMAGVSPSSFVLMLQHDPTAWRKKILPECHAQLTLSGHTHGGQFSIFGWSPASFTYDVWGGSAYEGDRAIYVSTGLGALIPFRLNMPGEIVVITLKSKKVKK